jgi:uncharacterized protein (DUF433 family)
MEPTVERKHIGATHDVCGGRPRIAGHRTRVQGILLLTEQGQSPDEIVSAYPQFSLADVHAALAYYYDHREEIDEQIRADDGLIEQLRGQSKPGPLPSFE